MANENKQVQYFKHTYDRLFQEFQSKLMGEYKLMQENYIMEYQQNYQMNLEEKQNNIDEFINVTIENKKQGSANMEKNNEALLSCIERFDSIKVRLYYYKKCFKAWQKIYKREKGWKRNVSRAENSYKRFVLQRIFRSWRGVTREEGR